MKTTIDRMKTTRAPTLKELHSPEHQLKRAREQIEELQRQLTKERARGRAFEMLARGAVKLCALELGGDFEA